MAFLTDRILASGVTVNDLLHIVIPSDPSQNPAGSSYKAKVSQFADAFSSFYVNTSGDTMTGNLFVPNLTANTISATTYYNLPQDVYVTGMTFNNSNYELTITRNDGISFTDDLTILASEVTITGGTYNPTTGVVTFTNNTGGTFDVSGFTTGYTDIKVTAYTYDNLNTFTIFETDGSTHSATIDTMSGLTINGNFTVTGNTTLSATTASTLNVSLTPTTDSSTPTYYLTRDGSTGEVKQKVVPGSTAYGLFSQTADGVPVTGTIVETNVIGTGVGTLTVPANSFQIGDSFQASLDGLITCGSSSEIEIRVKTLSGELLADTGLIDLAAATNKSWVMNLYFTIRSLGGAGTASISSGGLFSYIRNGGTQFEGYVLTNINNTTFDTTISNTLIITAQWNTDSIGNSILSRNFTLNKIY